MAICQSLPVKIRIEGESDADFGQRVEIAAKFARTIIDAAFANHCIKELISDPSTLHTAESQTNNPTIRLEYKYAYAIGGIGECLAATKHKNWGRGPIVQPLKPDDYVDEMRIIYCHRENSPMRLRYEQRKRLKQILGSKFRPLVGRARASQKKFLEDLTTQEAFIIRKVLNLQPKTFWQVARGDLFVDLSDPDEEQLLDAIGQSKAIKPKPAQGHLF